MNNVQIMVNEHIKIKRMLNVVGNICENIFNTKNVDTNDIRKIIDFIKNYADKHHHEKEEYYLFKKMVDHLGDRGKNLITHGMLVEHNFARLYLSRLEKAVNDVDNGDYNAKMHIISNLISYGNLINLHIEKEDNVVYTFGYNNLDDSVKKEIDEQVLALYNSKESKELEEKYLNVICELEKKYKK